MDPRDASVAKKNKRVQITTIITNFEMKIFRKPWESINFKVAQNVGSLQRAQRLRPFREKGTIIEMMIHICKSFLSKLDIQEDKAMNYTP